jgi:hypothetical protein
MANALGKLKTATGPWVAAAVIVVAGFMYWLYAQSTGADSGLVVADTVPAIKVAERYGRAVVTVNLPGSMGYPLILDRPVLDSGITVEPGDDLVVAGSVYALTDSLLDSYVQRGFFDSEYRRRLEGHSTFLLVDSLDYYTAQDTTTGGSGS